MSNLGKGDEQRGTRGMWLIAVSKHEIKTVVFKVLSPQATLLYRKDIS